MTHNLAAKERVKYTLADESALLTFLNTRKAGVSNGSGIVSSTNFKQADWKAAATMLNSVKTDSGVPGTRTSESCRAKYRQVS
jgi:hypothetical protein